MPKRRRYGARFNSLQILVVFPPKKCYFLALYGYAFKTTYTKLFNDFVGDLQTKKEGEAIQNAINLSVMEFKIKKSFIPGLSLYEFKKIEFKRLLNKGISLPVINTILATRNYKSCLKRGVKNDHPG
jgi:hypothetical protein